MTNKRLAFISSGASVLQSARSYGFLPTLVVKSRAEKPAALALADQVIELDYESPDFPVELAKAQITHPVGGVFSFTEYGLQAAANAAAHLGVLGQHPTAVQLTRNKFQMRQALREAGLTNVTFAHCDSPDELREFFHQHAQPVVVKDPSGTGKNYVRLVENNHQLEALLACDAPFPLIAESFVEGDEFSVEAVSFEGQHHVVAITRKVVSGPPHFNELGHTVAAPEECVAALSQLTVQALHATGLNVGISHTEIRLNAGAAEIIEMHTRVGGDRINDLVRLSTGMDLYDRLFSQISGQGIQKPLFANHAAIRFLMPPQGRLMGIQGLHEVRRWAGVVEAEVYPQVGEETPRPVGNGNRSGHVLVTAPRPEQAAQLAASASDLIDLQVQVAS